MIGTSPDNMKEVAGITHELKLPASTKENAAGQTFILNFVKFDNLTVETVRVRLSTHNLMPLAL